MNAPARQPGTDTHQLQQQLQRRASTDISALVAPARGEQSVVASAAGPNMDNMIELYSIRDVARIFALQESRLRYWMQTGFVGPTVRKGGRFYYRFADIIAVKAAKDLLAAGVPLQKVRKNLDALKRALPPDANAAVKLRICSDGETIVALAEDVAFVPTSGQIVMAFTVPTLSARVAQVLSLPSGSLDLETESAQVISDEPVPTITGVETTDANGNSAAYRCFLDGCAAEAAGDAAIAEHLFRQAMELEPSMAAAMTNLGNMMHRQHKLSEARTLYERALEYEPYQAEARYNFANVLEDMSEIDLAIGQLRQVCVMNPDFADAHYNLGVLLARMGGTVQAKSHLQRYLELDPQSDWASHARDFLAELAA